jgi:hypothetical protein
MEADAPFVAAVVTPLPIDSRGSSINLDPVNRKNKGTGSMFILLIPTGASDHFA